MYSTTTQEYQGIEIQWYKSTSSLWSYDKLEIENIHTSAKHKVLLDTSTSKCSENQGCVMMAHYRM
jgi:hypothetical protein